MYDTKLSAKGAIDLFTALKDNKKLKGLDITHNDVTNDACGAITTTMEKNSCLVELYMFDNPLSGEAIVNILNSLKDNNALTVIGIPKCTKDIKKTISTSQEVINRNRESRGYKAKLCING